MATVVLEAKGREKVGTGAARAVRNDSFVPGIVYGGNVAPEPICIAKDALNKYVNKSTFFSTVFEFNGVGKKGQKYLAKDAQFHPVTDQVLHVDFMRVEKGNKIRLQIPVLFTHEDAAPGLKLGGVLNVLTRKITVECEPDCIPEQIEVDLTGFVFRQTVHAFGLNLPEGVSLPNHTKNYTIATVVAPSSLRREEAKNAAATADSEATAAK
jgi:large subunit ribosomal protein L25